MLLGERDAFGEIRPFSGETGSELGSTPEDVGRAMLPDGDRGRVRLGDPPEWGDRLGSGEIERRPGLVIMDAMPTRSRRTAGVEEGDVFRQLFHQYFQKRGNQRHVLQVSGGRVYHSECV